MNDVPPAGLAASSMTGIGWYCPRLAGYCSRSDVLAAGTSYPPITLSVNVASNAPANVTNTASVVWGGGNVTGSASDATVISATTVTFTGNSNTTWTVPSGVTYITVQASGAGGGSGGNWFPDSNDSYDGGGGAPGGFAQGTIGVTPGSVRTVIVGAAGGNGSDSTISFYNPSGGAGGGYSGVFGSTASIVGGGGGGGGAAVWGGGSATDGGCGGTTNGGPSSGSGGDSNGNGGAGGSDSVSGINTISSACAGSYGNGYTMISYTVAPAPTADPRRTGVTSTGSYWGGAGEQIDLHSGNLNFTLPLIKLVSRGWGVTFALSYNSQIWKQNGTASSMLATDVGYGLGWTLQGGFARARRLPITPSGDAATGATYLLDQGTFPVRTPQKQGAYVSYDVNANTLYFPDGSFSGDGCKIFGLRTRRGVSLSHQDGGPRMAITLRSRMPTALTPAPASCPSPTRVAPDTAFNTIPTRYRI